MAPITGVYWRPDGADLAGQLAQLVAIRANAVFVPHDAVDSLPVEQLHTLGLRVYVDFAVFVGATLRAVYPDSVPVDVTGAVFDRAEWYVPVCPNHPDVRRQQLAAVEGLLDQHGARLDGLWLDFIRFPVRWEVARPDLTPRCFCRHCLNDFLQQDQTGYSPQETRRLARQILEERFDAWVQWKCDSITRFVASVRAAIDARDAGLQLGVFSLPWRRGDYDGAIRTVAGQDLFQLAQRVDVFSPMVYHRLCHRPASWIGEVTRDVQAWTGRPTLPIIQSLDRPAPMSAIELDHALQSAFGASPMGVMIFTMAPLLADDDKRKVVRDQFTGVRRA